MGEPDVLDAIYDHILNGEADLSVAEVEKGLQLGIQPSVLIYDAMIPALEEVGDRFETAEYFLPEMLTSANAMKAAMHQVRPHLAVGDQERIGTFVIGTVAGDIHDIGKNICSVMLEAAGFEVVDLGINVPSAAFVTAIKEHRPDVVGMSAFLTTTVPEIAQTMAAIEEAGVRSSVKVMIGGAPVTDQIAEEVGADGYAPNASSAARAAKAMLPTSG